MTGLSSYKQSRKNLLCSNEISQPKMVSKRSKIILYVSIIRSTLTYGCKTWMTTVVMEKRLRIFENKVWRKICGSVFDMNMGSLRRRYNREL